MTRARKSLPILAALKSGGAKRAHNFLDQLPETHSEFYSYKKSDRKKTTLSGKQGFLDYLHRCNFFAPFVDKFFSQPRKNPSKQGCWPLKTS
jgi:hypothetical protein